MVIDILGRHFAGFGATANRSTGGPAFWVAVVRFLCHVSQPSEKDGIKIHAASPINTLVFPFPMPRGAPARARPIRSIGSMSRTTEVVTPPGSPRRGTPQPDARA